MFADGRCGVSEGSEAIETSVYPSDLLVSCVSANVGVTEEGWCVMQARNSPSVAGCFGVFGAF
jgi:hypothetical protein